MSHSFCAEVPKVGVLRGKAQSDWQYFKKAVRMEKCEYSGSGMLWDHIHMLLEIPPKMSVSGFMGYLKGKSSLMLYEQFGDLKFKYRNREFWCRGYYVDTVGKNMGKIQEYIKHQRDEDKMGEQLSIPYPGSPFTGGK
ncbi:IS200/IS605 family transposase [Pectobacterium polaris]|nr:IS200/IS605 family transposase [Pectobacterium polaris]MCA6956335.1 IS200/IS605 family transposase [Pectobacterium polaris]